MANFDGSLADETFNGSDESDHMEGGQGNDSLVGGGGSDLLSGGEGEDTLLGGKGKDVLSGGEGDDTLLGGDDDDVFFRDYVSESGSDLIDGGNGYDTVFYKFHEIATGVTFVNTVDSGDQYDPSDGSTDLFLNMEEVVVYGSNGNDSISGGTLRALVVSGYGDDTLVSGAGDETLSGDRGDDTFVWKAGVAAGNDKVSDLSGGDSLSFRGVALTHLQEGDDPSGLAVGQAMLGTPAGGITMLHVRIDDSDSGLASIALQGTFGVSRLVLDGGADGRLTVLRHEVIQGTAKGEYLTGDSGDDTLTGGGGVDRFVYYADGDQGRDLITDMGQADQLFFQHFILDSTIRTSGDASTLGVRQVLVTFDGQNTLVQVRVAPGDEGVVTVELVGDFRGHLEVDPYPDRDDYADTAVRVIGMSTRPELYQGGPENDYIGAGRGDDTLLGEAGNDTLNGGEGADVLRGGTGDDTYILGAGDVIQGEAAAGGIDTIVTRVDHVLAEPGIENLTALAGTRAIRLTGNDSANVLTGNDGRNVLDGGAGADTLLGGAGNDTYYLDHQGDNISAESSAPGGGIDTVVTSVDYLATRDYVEHLQAATGTAAVDLEGNQLANQLTGNAGRNVLDGAAGADTLDGGAGADTLRGGEGNDTYHLDDAGDDISDEASAGTGGIDTVITSVDYSASRDYVENLIAAVGTASVDLAGNQLANQLTGNAGRNILNGRAGADILAGGLGNDTYHIDDAGDNIRGESSLAAGGIDTVISNIDWSASRDYVEYLVAAAGTAGIDLTGNQLANVLTGNAGRNVLTGADGADTLDGGGGADTLRGGAGNDTYVLDHLGDDISGESSAAGGGIDTVITTVDYAASRDYVEHLRAATGTASVDLSGNQLANKLTGNAGSNLLQGLEGADTLDGGAGADTLQGGRGNDTYHVNDKGDVVSESNSSEGGTDTVYSSVSIALGDYQEHLVLTGHGDRVGKGNALANRITGNEGDNTLFGNDGADRLLGGAGADKLAGGAGNDRFGYLETTDSTLSDHDVIYDFLRGADRIDLLKLDGNGAGGGIGDWDFIGSAGFDANATGQLRYAFDSASGSVMLYGSTDADRTAEFAVEIRGVAALSASDFIF